MPRQGVTRGRLRKVGAEIGIDGIDEIKANIAKILDRAVGEKAKRIWMGAAMIAVREVQDLVPKRTGRLFGAIFADAGDPKKSNVIMGVSPKKAFYANWVERGTAKMRARPYFRPGVSAARPAMAAHIAEGMRDLITKP